MGVDAAVFQFLVADHSFLSCIGNWQAIDLTTMIFPAIMQVDYVRVYQRKGHTNIGCDPPDYPTKNYIDSHPDAYGSTWSYHDCSLAMSSPNTVQTPT